MNTKELSQADRREPFVGRDDYGRKWETTWDTVGKGACAPINPKGWNDPIHTPQKYLSIVYDEDKQRKIFVDLAQWEADTANDLRNYEQRLFDDAMMLFGTEGPKAYEERAPALMHFTGRGPDPIELIQAAIDGNRWALGFDLEPDEAIKPFIPVVKVERKSFAPKAKIDPQDEEDRHDPNATGGKRQRFGKKSTRQTADV